MNHNLNELIKISKPIAEFILKNYDPKTVVLISINSVKLLKDEMGGSIIEPPKNT